MESSNEPIKSLGNRYTVDREIASGGGGSVYLAHDGVLNRWVAIKRIHGDGGATNMSAAVREATQLASLQHPNIVTIHDFLKSGDDLLVVMEHISGQNIDQLEGPMPVDFFMDFARQCLNALGAAHSAGIVHRDIKAGNIMLARLASGDFQVKLLDFGLAKAQPEPMLQTMDQSGAVLGSIFTMAPEQFNCQPLDQRTDLYSLGCVFYQALTATRPFKGKTSANVIAAHLQNDFIPLSVLRPDIPVGLCVWIEWFIACDPVNRPPNASAAAEALALLQLTPPPALRPALQPPPQTLPRAPLFKSARFAFASLGITAVLTLAFFTLDGKRLFEPTPKKETETKEIRDTFTADERSAILAMAGKPITITGTIAQFGEEGAHRFLTFEGSTNKDAMLFFDTDIAEFPKFRLVKFVGQKVLARGKVCQIDKRLLVAISAMSDLGIAPAEAPKPKPE